jgi:hypothetical protein
MSRIRRDTALHNTMLRTLARRTQDRDTLERATPTPSRPALPNGPPRLP